VVSAHGPPGYPSGVAGEVDRRFTSSELVNPLS
jgi:hypothetical protein